jgi:hypothetical protein
LIYVCIPVLNAISGQSLETRYQILVAESSPSRQPGCQGPEVGANFDTNPHRKGIRRGDVLTSI